MILRPVSSEKAVRMIELDNALTFEVDRHARKPELKAEVEKLFSVKVEKVRTSIVKNKKYVYVRLKKEHPAIDVATKIGMI